LALQAVGLRTYIWNNNAKSLALLAGFPLLLIGVVYAIMLLFQAASAPSLGAGLAGASASLPVASAVAFGVSGVWFGVAYVGHQKIIDLATGSKAVSRLDRPDLYNLLENLCVSRGMPVPTLRVIETPALNAFASGLTEEKAVVTVTRGLVDALDAAELEAVLAHELSHIRHRDIRLLVIAAVFVGIISVVGEMVFRGMFHASMRRSSGRSRRGGGGNAGALVLVAFAIIAVSYLLAIVVRFALSRRREFLADAGAVELTKNPDAMISALRKISGRSEVSRAPDEVREMFFDNRPKGFAGLFATHPPIEARIEALVRYGGGREPSVV
jgi:heat shock protein HtpX